MKLVVGLGNPGKRYVRTRHNIGFVVVDTLHDALREHQISSWELSKKFNAEVAGCTVRGVKILLAKPMTYMNDSGEAVQLLGHFYQIPPRDLIVIHDDKDLPLGEVKVQTDRGHAGHNGVRSIMEHIGTQNFTRVRMGIAAKDPDRMIDVPKFVLGKFGVFERGLVADTVLRAVEIVRELVV